MPIIPLGQAEYNSEENRNLIDTYNDNFRQLDWLLNKIKLDTQNIQSNLDFSQNEIEKIKQNILDQITQDGITEAFIKETQTKLAEALTDLQINASQTQMDIIALNNELNEILNKAFESKKDLSEYLDTIDEKTNPVKALLEELNKVDKLDLLTPQQKEALTGIMNIFDKGMFDALGINAKYLKFYPNRIYNSSFERFDNVTKKPLYWNTNGEISSDAVFDNTYSLKLNPNDFVVQEKVDKKGLINALWWSNWCERTRFSLRCKTGNSIGEISIKCYDYNKGLPLPLRWWIVSDGKEIETNVNQYEYTADVSSDWIEGLISFAVVHPKSENVTELCLYIENIGSQSVYIDCVQAEPDFTGKWSSFYTDGLESSPSNELFIPNKFITEEKLNDTLQKKINEKLEDIQKDEIVQLALSEFSTILNSYQIKNSNIPNNLITENKLDVNLIEKINNNSSPTSSVARYA